MGSWDWMTLDQVLFSFCTGRNRVQSSALSGIGADRGYKLESKESMNKLNKHLILDT